MFASPRRGNKALKDAGNSPLEISSSRPLDCRLSKEWGTKLIELDKYLTLEHYVNQLVLDAAKVVPSRFQKREGSIYATPGSRGQIDKDRDKRYHEKLKAMLGQV